MNITPEEEKMLATIYKNNFTYRQFFTSLEPSKSTLNYTDLIYGTMDVNRHEYSCAEVVNNLYYIDPKNIYIDFRTVPLPCSIKFLYLLNEQRCSRLDPNKVCMLEFMLYVFYHNDRCILKINNENLLRLETFLRLKDISKPKNINNILTRTQTIEFIFQMSLTTNLIQKLQKRYRSLSCKQTRLITEDKVDISKNPIKNNSSSMIGKIMEDQKYDLFDKNVSNIITDYIDPLDETYGYPVIVQKNNKETAMIWNQGGQYIFCDPHEMGNQYAKHRRSFIQHGNTVPNNIGGLFYGLSIKNSTAPPIYSVFVNLRKFDKRTLNVEIEGKEHQLHIDPHTIELAVISTRLISKRTIRELVDKQTAIIFDLPQNWFVELDYGNGDVININNIIEITNNEQ